LVALDPVFVRIAEEGDRGQDGGGNELDRSRYFMSLQMAFGCLVGICDGCTHRIA
jgi:hypothetical protein